MTTDLKIIDDTLPIDLGVADEIIAGLKGRLGGLKANTFHGYEQVKAGLSEVRTLRTGVDKARKELKQSALNWGRKVDAEARRVTMLILEIETPLKEEKARVDDEAERKRNEIERLRLEAEQRKEAAEREAREKKEAAEREEERKQREAERLRLEAERKQLAEERCKLDAERYELETRARAAEAQLFAAEEKRRLEDEAKEAAELKARMVELKARMVERRKQAAEAEEVRLAEQKAENKRLAAERKPDREKLADVATLITDLVFPAVKTKWAVGVLSLVSIKLAEAHEVINNALNE